MIKAIGFLTGAICAALILAWMKVAIDNLIKEVFEDVRKEEKK